MAGTPQSSSRAGHYIPGQAGLPSYVTLGQARRQHGLSATALLPAHLGVQRLMGSKGQLCQVGGVEGNSRPVIQQRPRCCL